MNSENKTLDIVLSEAELRALALVESAIADQTLELTNADITVIDNPRRNGKAFQVTDSVQFWLGFPIELRPLKFVPGRNRAEKRSFRKLATLQERGTIGSGQLKKLKRLYGVLKAAGVLRQSDEQGASK